MSISKLFSQCDEYLKKIDQKIRMEDYKRTDTTEKNLSEIKILFADFKKYVCLIILLFSLFIFNNFLYFF